ncbi:MAG: zinc-binding dehydrogenase [Ilumatobacter sp.]|nr:zinc-binding dehydrogenase [Ilumatobacter sp.]MDG2039920.1 zinc-binding dehydrogenase [Ilumatobacter sp.]
MTETYKKLVCRRYTRDYRASGEVIEVERLPPAPGQVLVRNKFGGTNASDVNISGGVYFSDGVFPFDLGCESTGEVIELGEGVADFAVGDCVVSPSLGSAYTELLYKDAVDLVKVPACSPEIMGAAVAGCTASMGLEIVGEMGSDETVLITAAAGGVGSWCVQLAKNAGNHVIGTCSTEAKAKELRRLGCDRVVLYRDEDLGEVLATEYPEGIDLIFEQVGQETFDICAENLALRGRLLICGFVSEYTSGPQKVMEERIYHTLLWKSAQVRAFLFSHWPEQIPEHLAKNIERVESGEVDPLIDPTEFNGVDQAIEAVEFLHSGKNIGKVTVRY